MRTRWTLAPLCLVLTLAATLTACERASKPTPTPVVEAPAVTPTASTDNSVPSAGSVFPSPNDTPKADTTAGRTNTTMTPRQESVAMPMAGQNNDHSAPVAPAKPGSAPATP